MLVQTIFPWLVRYKYGLIFPIAVIEGPIIMILTGFLASLGFVNFILALFVVAIGDLCGDSIYFMIGKYGKETFIRKYGHFIGINIERERKIENHFAEHADRTLLIGKFAHGVGAIILVAAGLANVPYRKVLALNALTTLAKTLFLMLVGYYFGQVYLQLNIYLNYLALGLLILFIVIYIVVLKRKVLFAMVDKSLAD